MSPIDLSARHLCELQTLTQRYARYSNSAGGLASVLGGIFCLASYLLGGLWPHTPWLDYPLVALPLVWVLIKQILVRHYYQRFGHVEEQVDRARRSTYWFSLGVVLLVAIVLTVSVALDHAWTAGAIGYLILVWLLVLAAWRWLRSPLDFFVGVFLFCQAALLCAGSAYPILGTTPARGALPMALLALLFPLAALALIGFGVRDHRRFLDLSQRLEQLRAGAEA